ncbi:Cytochrome c, mono-and diheme variants [Sphingomonas sp. YR710]|uniref:c-type cytochrome n=1 Tax=Sphingomonas sp. YR710 TaxID=1882773 RepID=UPI00088CB1AA|nr:cytochrome c [Sphingomonas sp. YR710]SDD20776.1 Cytochrome c, mono-and diheme variants [Sphingomonas sp. YR710]
MQRLAVMATLAVGAVAGAALAQGMGDTSGSGHATAGGSGGEQVYREICQACHMAHAEGGTGAGNVPALAANPHLADPDFVLNRLLRGQGGMPAFVGMLSSEQVAAVAGYVRTHFGNDYAKPVSVEDVKRLSAGLESGE